MTEREEKWSESVKEQTVTGLVLTFINQTVWTVCKGRLNSVLRWLRACTYFVSHTAETRKHFQTLTSELVTTVKSSVTVGAAAT